MSLSKFIFSSGLGNQLFMYAAYLSIRKRLQEKGNKIKPDLFPYTYSNQHYGFELLKIFNDRDFQDPLNKIKKKFAPIQKEGSENYLKKYYRLLKDKIQGYVSIDDKDLFDIISLESILGNNKKFRFVGYFQNPNFIIDNIQELRQNRVYYQSLGEKNDKILSENIDKNLVSIHIRRGDYVGNLDFDILNHEEYYSEAIKYMNLNINDPYYIVFSDDIKWVKENILIPINATFVDWNTGNNSWKDLLLMSKCSHNIIANSSFSYWGAILNDNNNKIVIAPMNWTKDTEGSKICPSNWILL